MSANQNDGGPAFPQFGRGPQTNGIHETFGGMTLRDYFAGQALQGMLAYSYVNPMLGNYHENCDALGAAQAAYGYADAMLKARATKPQREKAEGREG